MLLDKQQMEKLSQVITAVELEAPLHIRVHLRPRCHRNIQREAQAYFLKEELHKHSEHNNVLIYIGEKSQRFVLMGDRAVHENLGTEGWQQAGNILKTYFARGEYLEGLKATLQFLGEHCQ